MAKPRKPRINKVNDRDRQVNLLLSKGGIVAVEEILKYVSPTRMESWNHDRYWEKVVDTSNNNERVLGCRLTVDGRREIERRWGYFDHTNTKGISKTHDLMVGSVAASLPNKELIDTETAMWGKYYSIMDDKQKELDKLEEKRLDLQLSIQERDGYSKLWKEKQDEYDRIVELKASGGISAPDLGYTMESGEYICYEITTASYGATERAAKEEFAKLLGAKIQYVRA